MKVQATTSIPSEVSTSSGPSATEPAGSFRRITSLRAEHIEKYMLLLILIACIVFFSVFGPTSTSFPTVLNLQSIGGSQSVLAVAAFGSLLPLVVGQFDLSIGATIGLSSIVAAGMMSQHSMPVILAIAVAVSLGALVGLANGLCVAKGGINSLITTLGTSTIIGAIVTWYSGGSSFVTNISPKLVAFGTSNSLGVPRVLAVVLVVGVVVHYVLTHTPFGRYMQSIGSNPSAARLVGVNVDRVVLLSFVGSGAIAGIAGVLQVAHGGGGNPQIGATFTLPALAAGFLGATTIKPGHYTVLGTVVALMFLATLTSGMTLAGTPNYVGDLVNGGALLLGVGLARLVARRN